MKTAIFALISCSLLAGSAPAALLTVQFAGQVASTTPGTPASFRRGAPMVGHFTYDPQLPPGQQSADSPILVLEFPEEQNRLEMRGFSIFVRDNWLDGNQTVPGDGFRLLFYHPIMQSGGGGLSLDSADVTLFSNVNQLPASLPPLARFDANRSISFHYDFQLDYWAVNCSIEALAVTPGPATGRPIIFRAVRGWDGLSFHFIAEPSFLYTVESTHNPASGNWGTLTNVGPTPQKIDAIIRDSIATQTPRFYRVRKDALP